MKVIDFHVHLFQEDSLIESALDVVRSLNPKFDDIFSQFFYPPNPRGFSKKLEEEGMDKALVIGHNESATTGYLKNEYVAEFCAGDNRLLPVATINPNNDPDPVGEFTKCIEEWGMKGLKLTPSYGFFYPNEARLYPLYKKAESYKVPVIFHIGSSLFKGTKMKYVDPIYLDEVAIDFPDLTIIMAHSGRGLFYDAAFFLSRHHPNVYMDITGLPPEKLLTYFPEMEKNADKILFGSDWPAMPKGIKENVEAILQLPLKSSSLEKILWKNAEKILGLQL